MDAPQQYPVRGTLMPYIRNKRTGEMVFVPDAPQSIPVGPQDPTYPFKAQQARTGIQAQQSNMANDAARVNIDRQRLSLAQQEAARKAQDDAARLNIAQEAGRRADMAASRASEIAERDKNTKLAQLRALQNQIARTRQLYQQGPGATKGIAGALDYLPTPQNKQFDAAGASLGEIGLSAFRTPGVGSQSDAELKAFVAANRPSASDYDSQIEEKLRNLENRLRESYRAYGVQYKPTGIGNAPRKPRQPNVIDFNEWKD